MLLRAQHFSSRDFIRELNWYRLGWGWRKYSLLQKICIRESSYRLWRLPCNFMRMVLPWLSLCDCWLPSVSEQQSYCKAGAQPVSLSPWSKQLLLRKSDFFSEWPCTGANADIRDVSKFGTNFFIWLWWEKHTRFLKRLIMTSDLSWE